MLAFNPKTLAIGLILVIIAYAFWYYCMDTLMFSEVIGNGTDAKMGIFINLLDFNTQLSKYDVYNLKSKARKWEKRLQDIKSIRDPATRRREYEKVVREITADPSMKKVIKKVSIFGKDAVLPILEVINAF